MVTIWKPDRYSDGWSKMAAKNASTIWKPVLYSDDWISGTGHLNPGPFEYKISICSGIQMFGIQIPNVHIKIQKSIGALNFTK
jgi:hypothetical protein